MHHCLPKSFGLDEDRMSQVVQVSHTVLQFNFELDQVLR